MFGIFEEERRNIEQYGVHQSFNYSRNNKVNAFYSLFIRIFTEKCLRESNTRGSEANASHLLTRGITRHAPPIPLSKFT